MDFIQTHLKTLIEMIVVLLVMFISIKLVDIFDNKIRKNIIKKYHNSTRLLSFCPILNRISKALILFIIIASVMQAHGYSMTSLIAGFGIAGIAVGFAAQESVANIFGSLAILYDNIFDIGDYVNINGTEGTVIDINLRSTKIKTLDNSIITIPNNAVASTTVINISATNQRRFNECIGITYDTPNEKIEKAIEILRNILKSNDEMTEDYYVHLEQLNASSIDIRVSGYVKYPDLPNFRRVKQDIIMEIIKQFRQEGIDFAFPSQSIYIAHED